MLRVYSKLVSYPFLYSELVPKGYVCGDSNRTDSNKIGFYSTFSRIMYCMAIEDKTDFDLN